MVNPISAVLPPPVRARTKVWRAAKSAAPLVATAAVGVVAYRISPVFHEFADSVRAKINDYPNIGAFGTSAVTLGAVPDFLAQRYEGKKFDLWRWAGMTVLGSLVGGVYCQQLFKWQGRLFPEPGSWPSQIAFDQGTATPPYLTLYLTCVSLINRTRPTLKALRQKLAQLIPLNWAVWVPACAFLYGLVPPDLRVYAAQFLSILYFSVQSKVVNSNSSGEPATRLGRLLNTKIF